MPHAKALQPPSPAKDITLGKPAKSQKPKSLKIAPLPGPPGSFSQPASSVAIGGGLSNLVDSEEEEVDETQAAIAERLRQEAEAAQRSQSLSGLVSPNLPISTLSFQPDAQQGRSPSAIPIVGHSPVTTIPAFSSPVLPQVGSLFPTSQGPVIPPTSIASAVVGSTSPLGPPPASYDYNPYVVNDQTGGTPGVEIVPSFTSAPRPNIPEVPPEFAAAMKLASVTGGLSSAYEPSEFSTLPASTLTPVPAIIPISADETSFNPLDMMGGFLKLLPNAFDCLVYWGEEGACKDKAGVPINLKWILFAIANHGYVDSLLSSLLFHTVMGCSKHESAKGWANADGSYAFKPLVFHLACNDKDGVEEHLDRLMDHTENRLMTEARYNDYLLKFLSSKQAIVEQALKDIEIDVCATATILKTSPGAFEFVERLLVSLQGHVNSAARECAVRLLNVVYDGHDWQKEQSLTSKMSSTGDLFTLEISLPLATGGHHHHHQAAPTASDFVLQTCTPGVDSKSSNGNRAGQVWSLHRPASVTTNDKETLVTFHLGPFGRCGFHDWQLVKHGGSPATSELLGGAVVASGRTIVHARVKDETIHEIWVDIHKARWNANGEITQRGTFSGIASAIPDLAKAGITTLYVMGALDRSHFHPFAPTDRARPLEGAGGPKEFKELVETAHRHNMKIIVDATTRVSSRNYNRKYKGLFANTTDNNGRLMPHFATDGQDIEWQDCLLLNMRKAENWELLISDISQWATQYGVDGIVCDHAHTWPLMLEPDLAELMREDSDGESHYSLQEILDADVVIPTYRTKRTLGFWGTKASETYANPLFVKMARDLWAKFPSFIMLGEVEWSREKGCLLSGLIPFSSRLSAIIPPLFNAPGNAHTPGLKPRVALSAWYDEAKQSMPEGAITVHRSCTRFANAPYPCVRYGPGAHAFVDLLYMLPETPNTYIGEQDALNFVVDITNGRYSVLRHDVGVRADILREHYRSRIAMRANKALFRNGEMKLLAAKHSDQELDHIIAFTRYTRRKRTAHVVGESPTTPSPVTFTPLNTSGSGLLGSSPVPIVAECVVCAVNCSQYDAHFYLDLAPFTELFHDTTHVFEIRDVLQGDTIRGRFSYEEITKQPQYTRLPPFGAMCWSLSSAPLSASSERLLFESSMQRLRDLINTNSDPTHNHIFALLDRSLTSYNEFSKFLTKLVATLPPTGDDDYSLAALIQDVLFHLTHRGRISEEIVTRYLLRLSLTKRPSEDRSSAVEIAKRVLKANTMGPLVFITPEIAPWCTIGGIAVMVDELTQDLAKLGMDVHVISPYYNWNRDGKTDYLTNDGFEYLRNITNDVGGEPAEVGVHYKKMNGLHYYFLHNLRFFPAPYHVGSPDHQLQMAVLMAKASLELLCQIKILPAVVVTNDWFTGLVPGYVRAGSFGTVFNGATFFHLVHNLEEGYQGLIFPDRVGDNLGWIHRLPEYYVTEHGTNAINPSRCALLTSNQWGTVSPSYREDLMKGSFSHLLGNFPTPFAHCNGIRVANRRGTLAKTAPSKSEAKKMLQEKFFGRSDTSVPVFSFVGRITKQKGVHLILNAVPELITLFGGKIQIIVGGMANQREPYAAHCAWNMRALRSTYPDNFWADPDAYFTQGALVNYGSDFGLMPSLFEPSGVVQQEYFVAGTPVVAFWTGGLKDTVFEYDPVKGTGNGFVFLGHAHGDFVYAMRRAMDVYYKQEHNEKLRANAAAGVLDTLMVAKAWGKEFCSLRRKLWVGQPSEEEMAEWEKEESAPSPASPSSEILLTPARKPIEPASSTQVAH